MNQALRGHRQGAGASNVHYGPLFFLEAEAAVLDLHWPTAVIKRQLLFVGTTLSDTGIILTWSQTK